jgi:hypothetical protein
LQGLTPIGSTDYSLWKVTKKIKQITKFSPHLGHHKEPGQETTLKKAHAFAKHLEQVFQPNPLENIPEEDEDLIQLLETPYQLEPQIKHL